MSLDSPTVNLSLGWASLDKRAIRALQPRDAQPPSLFVSYFYLDTFIKAREQYAYRNWSMDSGAYTAYTKGGIIDLSAYIDKCLELRENDPTLTDIIALDVIGSGERSYKNTIKMKEAGVDAMPVFHIGDDWQLLKEYCKGWDKVGISCRFGEPLNKSYWFYDQCFARAWPKRFHSFGWMEEKVMIRYPLHSADSASWMLVPCGFGEWHCFGGRQGVRIPIRGMDINLRPQVDWHLALEERIRRDWAKEMRVLAALEPVNGSD